MKGLAHQERSIVFATILADHTNNIQFLFRTIQDLWHGHRQPVLKIACYQWPCFYARCSALSRGLSEQAWLWLWPCPAQVSGCAPQSIMHDSIGTPVHDHVSMRIAMQHCCTKCSEILQSTLQSNTVASSPPPPLFPSLLYWLRPKGSSG